MNPSEALKRAVALLYPRECAGCGADLEWSNEDYLCSACRSEVEEIGPPLCSICGLPVPGEARAEILCRGCRETRRPFRRARSVLYYRGAVQAWIKTFKYRPAPWLGPALSRTLVNGFRRFYRAGSVDVVVPVPLFRRREKERGFNQARVLGAAVARDLEIPIASRVLIRRRDTDTQALLPRKARPGNVRGAFAVRRPRAVRGRRVLLIDDVMTTGSTLSECARVLAAAGAAQVDILTLARAV